MYFLTLYLRLPSLYFIYLDKKGFKGQFVVYENICLMVVAGLASLCDELICVFTCISSFARFSHSQFMITHSFFPFDETVGKAPIAFVILTDIFWSYTGERKAGCSNVSQPFQYRLFSYLLYGTVSA